jgi:group II intron reverse transcriptase/maturase
MKTKLSRIEEIAREKPKEIFTSLYHHINKEMLIQCHDELKKDKAAGIDEVTKEAYSKKLEENIENLVKRLKSKGYRPQPARRVYIPKATGNEKRPLGIISYEDKIVQSALNKILQAIYEQDFLEISYGFRPNRSCHDALKEVNKIIENGKISYVVDADIKGFFNNVNHEWLIKFIEVRIVDPNIKRLVIKFLKAGVIEEGMKAKTNKGTPQGGIISPTLGNIYLHYTLDLWFEKIVKKKCRGEASIVRYCDDTVFCFQYKDEAEKFYTAMIKRLAKFNLEISEEKTKIIPFGRFAEQNSKRIGNKKPETFDFLGFTHYCSKSKKGKFRVKRKTARKKFSKQVREFKEWMKKARIMKIKMIMKKVRIKLIGHYNYFGITDNYKMISVYYQRIRSLLYKWLNRRSQKNSYNYDKFNKYLKLYPLPMPKICVNIYG